MSCPTEKLSDEYYAWNVTTEKSILANLAIEAEQDKYETRQMLRELSKTKTAIGEGVEIRNPEPYFNCQNCHVKFTTEPRFIELYNLHCSPNCALRSNRNAWSEGAISSVTHFAVVQRIEKFFHLDGIEPFPVFATFRGTVGQYHCTKPLPPGFQIQYYDRHDIPEDVMEVE